MVPRNFPDLTISGFALWVERYQFPDAREETDANWLVVVARCEAHGATVVVNGPLLMTHDIRAFGEGCDDLRNGGTGEASLNPIEPELRVSIVPVDRHGHLTLTVDITPDNVNQQHHFVFEIDQSLLAPITASCAAILARFPVRVIAGARGA